MCLDYSQKSLIKVTKQEIPMKNKIIITSTIFASLFLSACETASQKVVSGSAASNTGVCI